MSGDGDRHGEDKRDESTDPGIAGEPDPAVVVETAATAAEDVIFSRYGASSVTDLDVSVSYEEGVLEVDVYLEADEDGVDAERVADDAAMAARAAVDDLFAEATAEE